MTALEEFANFIEHIHISSLSSNVIDITKRSILEAFEALLSYGPDARKEAALRISTSVDCADIPSFSPFNTECFAFYFSTALSVNPRLDCHRQSLCHPGSVAIPVAFAVAKFAHKDGASVIEGIIAGYEAMIRLCLALSHGSIPSAVRRTALAASFCGAITAAKTLGLPASKITAAASLSLNFAFGLNEWVISGTGEDALQSAWGAKLGVFCAQLAQNDMPAASTSLEGQNGLLSAYSAQKNLPLFLASSHKKYYIS